MNDATIGRAIAQRGTRSKYKKPHALILIKAKGTY